MRCEEGSKTRNNANIKPAIYVLIITCVINIILFIIFDNYYCFTLDARSISLGRILLGFISLYDLYYFRLKYAYSFYTDDGMWPRTLILEGKDPQAKRTDFSPYMAVSSHVQIIACFSIVGIASFFTIIGYCTHFSVFILWCHTRGFAFRNSGVQQAGDTLHRLLLFWMMFLPSNEHFSIDSYNKINSTSVDGMTSSINSIATFGLLLQLSLIYQFTSSFKVNPKWTVDGSAIYYVLNNKAFVYEPFGRDILLKYLSPFLLSILTKSTVWLERFAPLFIFVYPLRYLGVFLFIGFHLGLYFSMRLGLFPLICVAGWIILIPTDAWSGDETSSIMNVTVHESFNTPITITFSTMIITFIENIMYRIVQIFAIYLAIASNINTLPKMQLNDENLSFFKCGKNHIIKYCINNYVLEMPKEIYEVARFLGQNQQWFLFDKPQDYSFWFDIVGLVEINNNDGDDVDNKKRKVIHVNLHRIYQQYINKTYLLNYGKIKNNNGISTYKPINTSENFNKDFNWDELFANNRFRKLYQRLADSKNRYNHFHEAFALHMGKIFDLSMKSNDLNIPNGSTLKELKFIAYRKQTLPWNDFVNGIQKIEDNNDDDADALSSTIACKEMWSYKYYLRVIDDSNDAKGKRE